MPPNSHAGFCLTAASEAHIMHRYATGLAVLLLFSHCADAGDKMLDLKQMVPSTSHPRSPAPPPLTHISEFTDPATGFNPFVDVEEGRANGDNNGRQHLTEEEEGPVADLPFPDMEPQEGDSRWRPPSWLWFSEEDGGATTATSTAAGDLSDVTTDGDVIAEYVEDEIPSVGQEEPLGDDSRFVVLWCAFVVSCAAVLAVGAVCWWRLRLRRSTNARAPSVVESGKLAK